MKPGYKILKKRNSQDGIMKKPNYIKSLLNKILIWLDQELKEINYFSIRWVNF